MPLFLSTFTNKLDKKGRVSVPSGFRSVLKDEPYQGVVLFQSHNFSCLEGFAFSMMAEMNDRLDQFDMFSAQQDDLATAVFASAHQLPIDQDGRIILSAEMVNHAQLAEDVCFVGMGSKFQIWNPALFAKRQEQARKTVKAKSLTLPSPSDRALIPKTGKDRS